MMNVTVNNQTMVLMMGRKAAAGERQAAQRPPDDVRLPTSLRAPAQNRLRSNLPVSQRSAPRLAGAQTTKIPARRATGGRSPPMSRHTRKSAILLPVTASSGRRGRLPEWSKGAVCKTVGSAYAGSSPAPATPAERALSPAETRCEGSSRMSGCPRLPTGACAEYVPKFSGLVASQIRRMASPCRPWMHLA